MTKVEIFIIEYFVKKTGIDGDKLKVKSNYLSEQYLDSLGIKQSGLDKLILESYNLLGLITFFTSGPKESHAWTIEEGTLAPQAAGVIHTDFEQGFIKAEIANWKDLIETGGEIQAKEKGLIKTEGKNYQIKDGDVAYFLFN